MTKKLQFFGGVLVDLRFQTANVTEFHGCYLIHFEEPVRGVRHYIGWAPDIAARVFKHQNGEGSQLTKLAKKLGVRMRLARTWPGATREFETELKARKEAPRLCPDCKQPRKRSPRKRRTESRGAERCPG